MVAEKKLTASDLKLKNVPITRKNKYSNSFKDQAQLGPLILRKGHFEEQRLSPFLLSTSKPDIHDSNRN